MLKSKGMLPSMILATLLGTGFAFVWCLLVLWLQGISRSSRDGENWQMLHFQADGTPVIQTAYGFRDQTGKPIDASDPKKLLVGIHLDAGANSPAYSPPATWEQRLRAFGDSARRSAVWYFLTDGKPHGSAYLVGYQFETNARIGYIGKAGFRTDEPPMPERFPFDGRGAVSVYQSGIARRLLSPQNPYSMETGRPVAYPFGALPSSGSFAFGLVFVQADDGKIYQIDLSQRTARVVLENKQLRSMQWIHDPVDYPKLTGMAVRTETAVLVLDQRMEIVKTFTLPPELRDKDFAWSQTSAGTAVVWAASTDLLRGGMQYEVYWLDPAGRIIRQEEIALQSQGSEQVRYFLGVAMPSPLALCMIEGIFWPLTLFSDGKTRTWPEAWAQAWEDYWPSMLLAVVVGASLACVCYRRESRYGASRTERALWALFVFAFGLFGWIGYRFCRSWPALVACPNCHAAVPCDRVACMTCRADFPIPTLKGTEIFA